MSSGKRDTVIIACVTFEVDKIVSPVIHYEATRVHLLNSSSGTDVYNEFYEEVCRQITERSPKTEIVHHRSPYDPEKGYTGFTVFDFQAVMNEVLCIIESERNGCEEPPQIFVNISAGTSEYSAASLMASMMNYDLVKPFTVSARLQSHTPHSLAKRTVACTSPLIIHKRTAHRIRIGGSGIGSVSQNIISVGIHFSIFQLDVFQIALKEAVDIRLAHTVTPVFTGTCISALGITDAAPASRDSLSRKYSTLSRAYG